MGDNVVTNTDINQEQLLFHINDEFSRRFFHTSLDEGAHKFITSGLIMSYLIRNKPPYKHWGGNIYHGGSYTHWGDAMVSLPHAVLLSDFFADETRHTIHSLFHYGCERMIQCISNTKDELYYIIYYGIANIQEDEILVKYLETHGYTFNPPKLPDETQIAFVFPTLRGELNIYQRTFLAVKWESILCNYDPSVVAQVQNLVPRLVTATNGLAIIHGPVGTGKTYLIRSLLSELRNQRDGLVCAPALTFLKSPSLLLDAAAKFNNPIFILEDLGELFQQESKVQYPEYFSNLINITDGLMSLLSNAIFILTFNYEESRLDPAFVRYGRCLGNILVPRLPVTQAKQLMGESGNLVRPQETYSLAEIYAAKGNQLDNMPLPKKSIGFAPQPAAPTVSNLV